MSSLRATLVRLLGVTFLIVGALVIRSVNASRSEMGTGWSLIAIGVCILVLPSFIKWYQNDDDHGS